MLMSSLFCLGVNMIIDIIGTALQNWSSVGFLSQTRQTGNYEYLLIFTTIYFIIIHAQLQYIKQWSICMLQWQIWTTINNEH